MSKPALLAVIGETEYFLYRPSLFKLYNTCYTGDEIPPYYARPIHHIRMMRELLFAHYVVVYMRVGGKTVGHFVVSRGGTRIAASGKEDIVIGPNWVIPACRGKGLGSKGIDAVLHRLGFEYRYAYEFIEDDNTASVRTVEKNGFTLLGRCAEYGVLKTIKPCEDGKLLVYRFEKEEA